MRRKFVWAITVVFFILIILEIHFPPFREKTKKNTTVSFIANQLWNPPDTGSLPHDSLGDLIRYGRELIVHTSRYFGPKGSVAQVSNGLNCENCHLDGGTRIFANNFSITAATYPVFKNRSNSIVTLEMRINGCFKRSLNGKAPGDSGREMKAMVAYIKWVGKDVKKHSNIFGTSTGQIPYLNRAADSSKGKEIFLAQCTTCHGENGQGKFLEGGREYLYPPLWGNQSFNTGAGLYQLSKSAGFIKNNMPFGTSYKKPYLSDEQAWDVAAYINSRPRPEFKDLQKDWPDISGKPADYPFGPYIDSFSENQHKYGPYNPIVAADKKLKKFREE